MNTENPRSTVACLHFSNLHLYQSHPPPHYGYGVKAPIFASTPMRTAFARGNTDPSPVNHTQSCCSNYRINDNPYNVVEQKMIRGKRLF
jgi:hypothetical protein